MRFYAHAIGTHPPTYCYKACTHARCAWTHDHGWVGELPLARARRYESGNAVKELLGTGHLKWDENKKQGAYAGQKIYDHTRADHGRSLEGARGGERGAGARRGNAAPAAPAPAEFPQVGEFYGGDCLLRGGAASSAPYVPAPHTRDALDALRETNYNRQEHHALSRPAPHQGPQAPQPNPRRLAQELQERHAAEASEKHVFGNSTAASILKTRPW